MKSLLRSSLLVLAALLPSACARTTVTDHAEMTTSGQVLSAQRLGRTLLVIETALPEDKSALADEARRQLGSALAFLPGQQGESDTESRLLGQARSRNLDSVLVIRVEDYARRGELSLGLAVPPVSWNTRTMISLRLKALDAVSGDVLADLRRDRERGGPFVLRSADDLPSELEEAVRSLITAG